MKILVIQQKMIGDVLTSTIICERLKEEYPDCTIYYLVNSNTIPVITNNPFIDYIVEYKNAFREDKTEFIKFLKSQRNEEYDIVIDVYSKIESAIISYCTKAKKRIGYKKWYTKPFYTLTYTQNKVSQTNAGLAIENRLKILDSIISNITTIVNPKIYITAAESAKAKQYLVHNGMDFSKSIHMVSILGSCQEKTYPSNYMALVIDHITTIQPNSQLLFNYIPSQKTLAEAIYNQCNEQSKKSIYFNVFGESLRDFLAITQFCDSVIGNEGGAINMAKAINTPTFSIYSPWITKEAWSMFEDGKQNISVHLKDYAPNLYNNKTAKELKSEWDFLYNKFTPKYILEKLTVFLSYNSK